MIPNIVSKGAQLVIEHSIVIYIKQCGIMAIQFHFDVKAKYSFYEL